MLERGKIISKTDEGYVVASLDRDGIVSPPMGADDLSGSAGTTLKIESSRGNIFKDDGIEMVLSVTITRGDKTITNIDDLRTAYGTSAYLQWKYKRQTDTDFITISADDSRLSNSGFNLTVRPADVSEKVVYQCDLYVDDDYYTVGDMVYYMIFNDGTGRIICGV